MTRLRFLPSAEAELLKEVAYYSTAQAGVGVRFHQAVSDAVSSAVANPQGGIEKPYGMRARLVRGFPFSVLYRASEAEFLVVAIAHHRRKPEYWADRLPKS